MVKFGAGTCVLLETQELNTIIRNNKKNKRQELFFNNKFILIKLTHQFKINQITQLCLKKVITQL
tara:strand:+ start:699 stop:893 length:195 start_codon:yes stop_codon:yes gene_type:complete